MIYTLLSWIKRRSVAAGAVNEIGNQREVVDRKTAVFGRQCVGRAQKVDCAPAGVQRSGNVGQRIVAYHEVGFG